ncbi:MAG: N5-carboxyaminoimidazole ribonucleotide mutase [Candidatus Hydrogenedentes bacterium ADurb.Bin179]|nr:MAG: N5-carboxyaminoimidazole ribonucleotide mutase [Candidatus Hydrogenedentes bacterium ADurb.Bin179]
MSDYSETSLVAVIMGSASDWETMERTHKTLDEFGVPHRCRVLSAHRTPELLAQFVRDSDKAGTKVFIAGAGLAAALPGAVAALTLRPVLGVPIQTGAMNGHDALMAIAQMPPGIPVGALAIGTAGAVNAALMAVAILANNYPEYEKRLKGYREEQARKIASTILPC